VTAMYHTIISNWVWQEFSINKASGKQSVLTFRAEEKYAGLGGFTLVDGVQNNAGMLRSTEFLGFVGKDMEVIIDLGSVQTINEVILHAFEQQPSWIYRPTSVSFFKSDDGKSFDLIAELKDGTGKKNLLYPVKTSINSRFIKVLAKNAGIIPSGK